jgi:hypothetical protein
MLKLLPIVENCLKCSYCSSFVESEDVFWQGMHVCVRASCSKCHSNFLISLASGHAVNRPYIIDFDRKIVIGDKRSKNILTGGSLIESLDNPNNGNIELSKEVLKKCERVIVLNCIDYLYGHCLLKLLNAQRHLDEHSEYGLIIIVQDFLRWLVPQGAAEIWTVNIPLKKGKEYYPMFHELVSKESNRFSKIYLSSACSHPQKFDIARFTGVERHSLGGGTYRITYIWREDRVWTHTIISRILKKVGLLSLSLTLDNWKIRSLFSKMRIEFPSAIFTVVGLGKKTKFPGWIQDERLSKFGNEMEKRLCEIYAESRLVIGIHGSNMLLPSAHAGMTIDLMPSDRWGNFAQDILYQENDPRLAAFRYRYIPAKTSIGDTSKIAINMIRKYFDFYRDMSLGN